MAFSAASDADAGAASLCTADRFRYPATRLQHELGLERAAVLALDQLACTTLFGAVRVARAMMESEGIERALCVASEFYPAHAGREALYNCTSDAACAILLERSDDTDARNRIVGSATITKGYYWDAAAMREEVVASYFPTAVHAMRRALDDADWRAEDVDWVIPHNVSARSWDVLLRLARLPEREAVGAQHRATGTRARRRQLHQPARRDRGGRRARRSARAALLLWIRRALDGARRGGLT